MKIQEMKSGILRLPRKTTDAPRQNVFEMRPAARTSGLEETLEEPSELDSPMWSVVSFDRVEASELTHDQAVRMMTHLHARGVAGLCIVTNEAAERARR